MSVKKFETYFPNINFEGQTNNTVDAFYNLVRDKRRLFPLYNNEIPDNESNINKILKEYYIKYNNSSKNKNTKKNLIIKILKPKTRKQCDVVEKNLSNIDYNCLSLPLKNIKYIIGPISYQQYKYNDKYIYIFGEGHTTNYSTFIRENPVTDMTPYNTLLFSSLIHTLITNNPEKTYDLHLETGRVIQNKTNNNKFINDDEGSGMINNIKKQFKECFIPRLRKNCKYTNLRTHYTDYRFYIDEETNKTYYNLILEYCIKNTLELIIPKILNSYRLNKQITNIKDETLRRQIVVFFTSKIQQLIETHNKDKNNNKLSKCSKYKLSNSNVIVFNIGTLIMDIYSIARIFRDFNVRQQKKKTLINLFKSKSKSNNTNKNIGNQKNIIYYCGNSHANIFKEFMDYIKQKPEKLISPKTADNGEMLPEDNWYLSLNLQETTLL
jgi:hypothetical protein